MSIEIPEGKELDLDKSTIVFKDKCEWPTSVDQLPKEKGGKAYVYLADKTAAIALSAMRDLLRLRDAYRNGWEPDYKRDFVPSFLTFETKEQLEHFLKHHEELIKQAIPLMS